MNLHECPKCGGRVSILQEYDGAGNVRSELARLRCTNCLYAAPATVPLGVDLAAVALADHLGGVALREVARAQRTGVSRVTAAQSRNADALQEEVDRLERELAAAKRPPHLPLGRPFVGLAAPNGTPCAPNTIYYLNSNVFIREYVTAFQVSAEVAKRFQLESLTVGMDTVHDRRQHGVVLSKYDDGTFGVNLRPVIAEPGVYVSAKVVNVSLEEAVFEASVLGMPEESCTCHRVTASVPGVRAAYGPYLDTRRMPTTGCIVHRGM